MYYFKVSEINILSSTYEYSGHFLSQLPVIYFDIFCNASLYSFDPAPYFCRISTKCWACNLFKYFIISSNNIIRSKAWIDLLSFVFFYYEYRLCHCIVYCFSFRHVYKSISLYSYLYMCLTLFMCTDLAKPALLRNSTGNKSKS